MKMKIKIATLTLVDGLVFAAAAAGVALAQSTGPTSSRPLPPTSSALDGPRFTPTAGGNVLTASIVGSARSNTIDGAILETIVDDGATQTTVVPAATVVVPSENSRSARLTTRASDAPEYSGEATTIFNMAPEHSKRKSPPVAQILGCTFAGLAVVTAVYCVSFCRKRKKLGRLRTITQDPLPGPDENPRRGEETEKLPEGVESMPLEKCGETDLPVAVHSVELGGIDVTAVVTRVSNASATDQEAFQWQAEERNFEVQERARSLQELKRLRDDDKMRKQSE